MHCQYAAYAHHMVSVRHAKPAASNKCDFDTCPLLAAARQKELITAQAGTGLGFNPVGINFGVTGRIGGVTKNLYNFRWAVWKQQQGLHHDLVQRVSACRTGTNQAEFKGRHSMQTKNSIMAW